MSAADPRFPHDPSGMRAKIAAVPEQIEAAVAQARTAPWRLPAGAPTLLAAGAMGGSAIGADLAAAVEGDRLPHPVLVTRDYRWPAYVRPGALAALASFSGSTEETLALYDEAGARGVPRVAITTGGELAERCARDGVPWWRVPAALGPPRAAAYASWAAWSFLLHALGWTPDPSAGWTEAARQIAKRRAAWGPEGGDDGLAQRIARACEGRLPLIYAATERMAPVALRWRHQVHENAKLLAHSAVVPELDHNEIVGWERRGPIADRVVVLVLRDPEDAPEVSLRLALTREFVERQGAATLEIAEPEGGRLARLASMVYLGDWVSFHLAMRTGADPTPIPSIDAFKQRLSEERARHAR